MIGATTTVNIAATDTVIGSGYPTRIFSITVLSDSSAGVAILKNGSTAWATPVNTASKSVTTDFGEEGVVYPSGCTVDVDANCLVTLVTYRIEEA